MGKRGKQSWSRETAPVGTIRVRKHSKRNSVRMVKVSLDGPPGRRWMTLARFTWLNTRGPIPDGMRVIHADGNPLNDDPENYILGTAGDVAFLAREWDPGLDASNAAAVAIATAKCNRDRSRIRRALEYLPTRWYAVDVAGGHVINDPYRSRVALYRGLTGRELSGANGAGIASAWLGWPQVNQTEALLLCVLSDHQEFGLRTKAMLGRVNELRSMHGWGDRDLRAASVWTNGTTPLRRRGWIRSERVPGVLTRRYWITLAGLEGQQYPSLPFVAVRGEEIEARFPGFAKVWPGFETCFPENQEAEVPS